MAQSVFVVAVDHPFFLFVQQYYIAVLSMTLAVWHQAAWNRPCSASLTKRRQWHRHSQSDARTEAVRSSTCLPSTSPSRSWKTVSPQACILQNVEQTVRYLQGATPAPAVYPFGLLPRTHPLGGLVPRAQLSMPWLADLAASLIGGAVREVQYTSPAPAMAG